MTDKHHVYVVGEEIEGEFVPFEAFVEEKHADEKAQGSDYLDVKEVPVNDE